MKKILVMAVMMVMTISANAMSYTAAKNEALFLSDKMAYELNLTDAQAPTATAARRRQETLCLQKNGNRPMAMNTNRSGNGNSHFGGRR